MDIKVLGKTLQQIRMEKGMSQDVLSGLADIDRSHLSKIELGLRAPTVIVLNRLTDALEIKMSKLFRMIEDVKKDV